MSQPDPLKALAEQLQRLPGIGVKSAQRLAFHILKTPREEIDRLADAMRDVKDRVTYCSTCTNITDVDPCYLLHQPRARPPRHLRRGAARERRGHREDPRLSREVPRAAGGAVAPARRRPGRLEDQGTARARGAGNVEEVILATNPNVEGEATAIYLAKLIKPLGVRVTRIAMGVPVGSDLEYADDVTMSKAMEGRREV
jgi:recombination protein RecR